MPEVKPARRRRGQPADDAALVITTVPAVGRIGCAAFAFPRCCLHVNCWFEHAIILRNEPRAVKQH